MYKAVVFFFSGTGNTWWVADRIKKQLDQRGINADTVSIDTVDAKKADWWIKASDIVFFGWPVYGSDLPAPMKRFIDGLMTVEKGKHVHTFCTQMKFSGDGAWLYHKNFEAKGLVIDTAEHFVMPSNISVWNGLLAPPKNEEKIARIMDACEKKIALYIDTLMRGAARVRGRHAGALGIWQRAPYRLFYKNMQDLLGVDKDRCTKCGLCARLCPSANIKMKDFPVHLGQCDLCMRCYAFCPENAITYRGKTRDVSKKGAPYILHDRRFKPTMLI
jgi:ferredoxin/menaquinone-dependent protoporphyrinogen IX oxidase